MSCSKGTSHNGIKKCTEVVRKIKVKARQLPCLNLPHRTAHKIVEIDALISAMKEFSNRKLMAKKSCLECNPSKLCYN